MKRVKSYLLLIVIVIVDVMLLLYKPGTGVQVLRGTWINFSQMLGILPPIFLLIGLLDVWVPRETVMKYMGDKSGIRGIALSILLGAAAAGPLYAAFPIASIMIRKGVKYLNVLVFLGAWSTLKIPMFLFEMASLGQRFAVTRLLLSFSGILAIAWLIDRLTSAEEKKNIYLIHNREILK